MKNWFGTPNEAARLSSGTRTAQERVERRELPRALPMMDRYDFKSLDHEQRIAVRQTANELLLSYVDPEAASRPPLSGVINYMLQMAGPAQFLVAPSLIVCPDDVVEFKNIAALVFQNILIYGNGRIVTKSKMKIHALQIQHVNA